jgi:hypothetical protein
MKQFVKRIVSGGEKGYVPFYSDPPNIKTGQIDNNEPVFIYKPSSMTAEEKAQEQHSGYSKIYDGVGYCYGYMEDTHLKAEAIDPEPEPGGEWVEVQYRFENGRLYLWEKQ